MEKNLESKLTRLKLGLIDFLFGKPHSYSTEQVERVSSGIFISHAKCEAALCKAIGIRNYIRARIGAYLNSRKYNKKL